MESKVKQFLFFCMLIFLTINIFAAANPQANNSQPIVLLGEMNDKSPGAESYESKILATPKVIQEQQAISAAYDQKQMKIEEEEEYFDGMDMYGEPFGGYGGYGDMYDGPGLMMPIAPVIPITQSNNDSTNQKPEIISTYESQLPNGDILFKQ